MCDSLSDDYKIIAIFDKNRVSLDCTVKLMETRSVEGNGSSEFKKKSIISLILVDEKFVVTPVPLQYHGNRMKLYNFANRLYLSVFVEMGCFMVMCVVGRKSG